MSRYIRKINQSIHIGTQSTKLSIFWRDGLAVRLVVGGNPVISFGF